jgi:hypothetical protein
MKAQAQNLVGWFLDAVADHFETSCENLKLLLDNGMP